MYLAWAPLSYFFSKARAASLGQGRRLDLTSEMHPDLSTSEVAEAVGIVTLKGHSMGPSRSLALDLAPLLWLPDRSFISSTALPLPTIGSCLGSKPNSP